MADSRWKQGPGFKWELGVVMAASWLAFVSIPLMLGAIGISWDALNHHIYLGWTADRPRFDRDFIAASYQAYQFPYLYWPVYMMAAHDWPGAWAGAALVTLYWLAVPAVWLMARLCIPGGAWFHAGMRTVAVALAFMSGLVLSMFDSTSNDLLATVPFVWALALALKSTDQSFSHGLSPLGAVLLSGLLAGISVACKLSNGPLALLLPFLWLLSASALRERLWHAVLGCVAVGLGFLVTYGYWGWQLWVHFGNPVYPFYDPAFAPLRELLGWRL